MPGGTGDSYFLIFFSTMVDYFAGLKIYSAKNNFSKKVVFMVEYNFKS